MFSRSVRASVGTRQGVLSSPFVFNIFYQELVDVPNQMNCGISISSKDYNVFCYADEIMLTSKTSTGFQILITAANKHHHMAIE